MSVVNVTHPTAEPGGESTIVEGASSDPSSSGDLARGTTIGRYVVLDRVGAGGMGVVYAAYDPELDRKVAVKVLHRVGQSESAQNVARARLLREAQALAKLPHPNVVAIHDVGTFAARAWIAMEFVTGETMTAWLRAEQRPWTAVLDVLLAAGDGVAAAHAADLLHRDLKPDNIMIDDTGRVRVMDFGLARGRDLEATERSNNGSGTGLVSSGSMLALDVSAIGSLVGTPAYMAPEQLGATAATVASDQFAFCVTCWEALFGVRPFTGDSVHGHLAAMLDGPPRRGARSVPAWLRRVLERGLAIDPTARHRSMPALLRALRMGRQRARQRNLGLAALGLVAIGVGVWGVGEAQRRAAIDACEREAQVIATQWPGRAAEIDDAIRSTDLAYSITTAERLPAWLDRFATRWTDAATAMCRAAEVDKSIDAALHTRARACLDAHAVSLEVLLDSVAEGTKVAAQTAVSSATRLPDPTECTDARELEDAPWSEEIDHRRVAELRARFARAEALDTRSRTAEALPLDDENLADAIAIDWPPLVAEARMRRGERLSNLTRLDEAETVLRAAYFEAVRSGADRVAARAATGLVRTVGYRLGRHAEGLLWGEHARTVLDRLGDDEVLDRAALDLAVANVLRESDSFEEAQLLDEAVLASLTALVGEHHPSVANANEALGNTLHLMGRPAEATAAHRRALAIREEVFGNDHPEVAASLNNLANTLDAVDGAPLLRRAIEIAEAAYGPDSLQLAASSANLGGMYLDLGRFEEAKQLFIRALAIEEKLLGPEHHEVAGSYANLGGALLELGEIEEALTYYERALAIMQRRLEPGHYLIAHVQYNVGLARAAKGDHVGAEASLRAAKASFGERDADGPALGNDLRLAAVLRRQGRLDEAEREISSVRGRNAGRPEPLPGIDSDLAFEQGAVLVARGDHVAALELFERALGDYDADSVGAARIRFWIAMSRLAIDGFSDALLSSARAAQADLVRRRAAPIDIEEAQRRLADAEDAQSRRR
jgi:tetratricopeptide (TPR) repeat protein